MLEPDPAFADYHRARHRRVALIACGWALAVVMAIGGMLAVGSVTASSASATAASTIPVDAAVPLAPSASAPTALAPVASTQAPPTSPPAVRRTDYAITIEVTGFQTELDACQWVRMDLLDTPPLVGAHTRCGGAIVLEMQLGDAVTFSGQGLDGRYRVADFRDAHTGDAATTATAGMSGAVILQTCYPGGSGRVRLVGLIPA